MSRSSSRVSLEDLEFGKTLGEGSYGTVSLATLKTTGAEFAVKILSKKQLIKENKVQWVSRERDILNALDHPFIVKLHYALQDAANLYFVMELCPGGELFDHIKRLGSFNLKSAIHYTAEIIASLEYLHSQNIVHRDLKPENILLINTMHIKLIDFGTAKSLGTSSGPSTTGRSNSFCGTAEYVSPELLNEKPVSKSCDLWALGCIIYQLISGRPPFKGKTQYQTFQLVQNRKFVYPHGFGPSTKDIIDKLLNIDPELRLGAQSYEDLKKHNFFLSVDWDNITTGVPPPLKAPLVKVLFPADEQEVQRLTTISMKRKQTIALSLLELDEEVHLKIFCFLGIKDLLSVGSVNKQLQQSVADKKLWDPLFARCLCLLESTIDVDDKSNIETEMVDHVMLNNEVQSGSVNCLVDFLINETGEDFSFKRIFLLTYQTFMKPASLLLALFRRYNDVFPVQPRLLRLVSVLKTWLDLHFADFDEDMIWALRVFIRGKLRYDASPVVSKDLQRALEKKINNKTVRRYQSTIKPTPKIFNVPAHHIWSDLPEEEFARQLTLTDFAAFKAIKTSELFNKNWISENANQLAPNVRAMMVRWNSLCSWVPGAIVSCERLKDRVKVFCKLIHIAHYLRELNNFNGLMAFVMGFRGAAVSRLRFTLEELPKKEKKMLHALETELFDENQNVKVKYGELLRKAMPPCIPYVNFILKDLLAVENEPNETPDGAVNFRKRREIYNVISRLEQYTTCDYALVEVTDVVNLLDRIEALDEAENFRLSKNIEPSNCKKSEVK
eukprot:TRINITY_DN7641_c0_g1_i1.p1 TRINITY_DN7641_c0_g1~~TRINITY_DN7641_c0_g1_i1.p1  ORF type:complete len:783 (-),score=239.63 TRINITY_DN7641_c0_g1_i1:105-2453(-)